MLLRLLLAAALIAALPAAARAAEPSTPTAHEETRTMHHAKGTFEVKVKPIAFENAPEAAALSRLTIDKVLSGELVGTTVGQMFAVGTTVKDSGVYVAVERVTGKVDGRSGTFALYHVGTMRGGSYHMDVRIVPDSGTEDFAGIEGEFKILIKDGVHYYELVYSLPGK